MARTLLPFPFLPQLAQVCEQLRYRVVFVDYKNKSSGVWYGHVVWVKNKKIKNGLAYFLNYLLLLVVTPGCQVLVLVVF